MEDDAGVADDVAVPVEDDAGVTDDVAVPVEEDAGVTDDVAVPVEDAAWPVKEAVARRCPNSSCKSSRDKSFDLVFSLLTRRRAFRKVLKVALDSSRNLFC